jgi:Concanavalin A-like lectin/glucanases superfamily
VLGTPGLIHYYRFGESAGPTIADSFGTSNGTITGGKFGEPGAITGDPNTSLAFNGTTDSGAIGMNLSASSHITVEFWLKWSKYSNNEDIALELTPNFNTNAGGFLVDPNAAQFGGTFGVGIGKSGATRNTVFFTRPSAGVWHYYSFVLDSTQPAATQIIPYVDGQPVSYQKANSGTGEGAFASSTLYLMSRAGTSLFSTGNLDELAIYNTDLSASTVSQHYGAATP